MPLTPASVLLALSSLGTIVINRVSDEMNYVGNARRGAQAHHVTEAGAYTAVAFTQGLGPLGIVDLVDGLNAWDPVTLQWTATPITPDQLVGTPMTDFFDYAQTGSFGYEGWFAEQEAAAAPSPKPPVTFEMRIEAMGMTQPIVGYSLSGDSCRERRRYQYDSDGNVTDQTSEGGDTLIFGAWKRVRAQMNVGPLPCAGQGGAVGST